MHTRSTHMGPTWDPYVLFWAIRIVMHTRSTHIPCSKTDGTHMGFIWAGWGPYAPLGNHVGPIWAIRIVMHTRSTHMGPTWVPCVVLGNLPRTTHMGPTWNPCGFIQLAKINALGRWNSPDGSQVHPRCVLMIW